MQIEDSFREHNREDTLVKELPIFIISTGFRRTEIPFLCLQKRWTEQWLSALERHIQISSCIHDVK